MKRVFFILSVALLLSACSKNGSNSDAPDVTNPPHNIVKATIADYGTVSHLWSEGDLFGLYGNRSGSNVRYVVEAISYEKSGEARIYGRGVDGDVYGYYPYCEEGYDAVAQGRQPLPALQSHASSAREQMMQNTVLVAKLENEAFSFSWLCGVLHLHLTAEVAGTVSSATLLSADAPICGDYSIIGTEPLISDPGTSVTQEGINSQCSEEKPIDLYFMLPPGTYPALSISLTSEVETVVKPIDLSVSIASKTELSCTVTDKETIYEGTDIIIIDGEFDQ